jgi:hypothetical protein
MNQCKPCITIRTIAKLLWKNYVIEATSRFKQDYKSYRLIGLTECVLPAVAPAKPTKDVLKVRELASGNYDPIRQEQVEQYINKRNAVI